MKKIYSILFLFCFVSNIFGQNLQRILVLNEGRFDFMNNRIDVPVSVGAFNMTTKQYSKLVEIADARFATDIQIDGDSYWVAADRFLNRYDIHTNQLLSSTEVEGIRRFAFYQNKIIISRGEYLKTLDANIIVLDKSSLLRIYAVPFDKMPYTTESIVVDGDQIYIAANNGFEWGKEVGQIINLDLNKMEIASIKDLGPNAKNPENLMIRDHVLYTVNNKDYTGSSITALDIKTQALQTINLPGITSLCGTSAMVGEHIYYQESGKQIVGSYALANHQASVYKDFGRSFYGMTYDPISKLLVAAETDFVSKGNVYVYNQNEEIIHQFDASVAPGNFAFEYTTSTKVNDNFQARYAIYPNPSSDFIFIKNADQLSHVEVINAEGKTQQTEFVKNQINIKSLESGVYYLRAINASETFVLTFTKK